MQFSIIALAAAFAATTTASYLPTNGTTTAIYPTGTGSLSTATGTGSPSKPTSQIPFTGAAAVPTQMAGSALGLVVVGGVALLF
ncbi:hypothetical protein N0V83_004913 [Neocucurbitaria cava]|uniref:Uncharacterized protein n=1 Tax=Neocucurbitaria cava TaxID=798079 RepID=A0A9W9CMN0_9PLEO|nr:hypothetical protein N0V83_004913 [Neocucurbitaria cava]